MFHKKTLCACLAVLSIAGCSNQSTRLDLNKEVRFPNTIAQGKSAVYEANISFSIMNAMIDPTAEIISLTYPENAKYSLEVIESDKANLCWKVKNIQGYQFTPNNDLCSITLQLYGKAVGKINDTVTIATKLENLDVPISYQAINIPINTEIVDQQSGALLNINVAPIMLGIDTQTTVKINNPNDVPINNLKIHIADWLNKHLEEQNLESVYSLGSGQEYMFTFNLGHSKEVIELLNSHENELRNNASSGVIKIEAANIKAAYKPNIKLILQPATLSNVVIGINGSDITKAVKFYNQSSAVLKITKIDTTEVPDGISVFADVCLAQEVIPPNETCSIEVTNESLVTAKKVPLIVHYRDQFNNTFIVRAFIFIEKTNSRSNP